MTRNSLRSTHGRKRDYKQEEVPSKMSGEKINVSKGVIRTEQSLDIFDRCVTTEV